MSELMNIRVKSFLYEAGSLIGVAIAGVLVSPDFQSLVTGHFEETVVTSTILLVITGIVKHIRNVKVSGKLGADGRPVSLI